MPISKVVGIQVNCPGCRDVPVRGRVRSLLGQKFGDFTLVSRKVVGVDPSVPIERRGELRRCLQRLADGHGDEVEHLTANG